MDKRKQYPPTSALVAADVRTIGYPRSSIGGNDASITISGGVAQFPHTVVGVTSTLEVTLVFIPVGNETRQETMVIPAAELTPVPCFDRIITATSTGWNASTVSYWS